MTRLKNLFFFVLLMVLGCGQQMVEFPLDAAPTVTATDPLSGAIGVALETKVTATFSEAMKPATLTDATFTLTLRGTVVPAGVSYVGTTATLTPTVALEEGGLYTATITTGAKSLRGQALEATYQWSFHTRGAVDPIDTTPPSVTFTDPADGAVAVPVGVHLSAAFSEAMDPTTLTDETFTVTQGAVAVPGVVTFSGLSSTFVPTVALAVGAAFTATLTTGAKDLAGNALVADYVWTFTTSDSPDMTSPTVTFTEPTDNAMGVSVNTTIQAAFSETMDCATLNAGTFTLLQGLVPVLGMVSCAGPSTTFTPAVPLAVDTVYTATLTTGAKDLAGNALVADYVWTFTTSDSPDITSPTVTFTDPTDNAMGVSVNTTIQAAFSETMDCATLSAGTFTLLQGLVPVLGMVSCIGASATFTPANMLALGAVFTATITTGAKDLSGNPLVQDYVWSFETGANGGLSPVPLGAASSYAILAFNTVTNVNNPGTIVTGDLGISPGAALVGFPPGLVVGTVHAGDPPAAAAKAALLAAYNDAAGRLGAAVLPGDLSGLTFAPGLYKNETSVMIAAGNFTLDAQGDANAVFIFQMGSTLTTNAGTQVVLAGGAKATNVFWAVGTSATLGTNSIFKGTILAASAITMTTGAVIEGRLLAQAAAVELDTNLITVPAP